MRKVEVVPYSCKWQELFELESKQISQILGDNIIAIHHIGSTSIPSIYAKPIIDFLVEVKDLVQIDQCNSSMQNLGYQQAMGEFGIPGRRFFRKDNTEGLRTHHIHIFQSGSEHIERHLAFRDYMIAHPDKAQAYSDLKRQLAKQHPFDIEAYMDGKDGFIKEHEKLAIQWRQQSDVHLPTTH